MNAKISQLEEKLQQVEEEIRQSESQIHSAHNSLVNASRDGTKGDGLDGLASAELVLKARAEALQQIRSETLAAIDQAKQEEVSREHKQRLERRAQLEKELQAAAKASASQIAQVEKMVRNAIDELHVELTKNVDADKTLLPHQRNYIARSNKDFQYLYGLYAYFERSRAEREMIAGFEQVANAISART